MLVLLGVANFFGTRFYTTVDLTENKRFSISNQTKQKSRQRTKQVRPVNRPVKTRHQAD